MFLRLVFRLLLSRTCLLQIVVCTSWCKFQEIIWQYANNMRNCTMPRWAEIGCCITEMQ